MQSDPEAVLLRVWSSANRCVRTEQRRRVVTHEAEGSRSHGFLYDGASAGNHAFAREFNDLVPDTWSIINDQVCAWWRHVLHAAIDAHQQ